MRHMVKSAGERDKKAVVLNVAKGSYEFHSTKGSDTNILNFPTRHMAVQNGIR